MVDATGGTVEIFRVSFLEQRQGAELVGESSSLLGGHLRWRAEQRVSSAAGIFRETEAADPTNGHSLIWSRYRIGGRPFVWPLGSQLWYGLNAIVGSPLSTLIARAGRVPGRLRGRASASRRFCRQRNPTLRERRTHGASVIHMTYLWVVRATAGAGHVCELAHTGRRAPPVSCVAMGRRPGYFKRTLK